MRFAPAEALDARLARTRAEILGASADALLVTHLPNLAYLTNHFGTAGAALITPDAVHIVVDARYAESVRGLLRSAHGCPGARQVPVAASYDETIVDVIAASGARRVGVEAESLTLGRFRWFERAVAARGIGAELVPLERIVAKSRVVKDAHEIALLREAAARLSAAAAEALDAAQPGRTERDVAARIDFALKTGGFDRPAFDTIVAAGERAALPHARPTDRTLGRDELVVLDFGGVYGGYCVDLTRTLYSGVPGENVRRVFAAVQEAQAAAFAAVRPGARGWDVDAAARRSLSDRGLADAFSHGTGHGLGLEIHEEPRIVQRRPDAAEGAPGSERLEPGMVCTIEPGVYLAGWGGVRIEDDVLVTVDGAEVLTDVPVTLTWPASR